MATTKKTSKKLTKPVAKASTASAAAAAAPATSAPKAAPAPAVKPAPVIPAAPKAAPAAPKVISQEERSRMIQESAYYIAERRGFQGNPHDDWVAAEIQIDAELARKGIKAI